MVGGAMIVLGVALCAALVCWVNLGRDEQQQRRRPVRVEVDRPLRGRRRRR